ncbi:MAG: DUF998 domain-containing protein [Scytonematopsis contorta HA4267-MV1]|nr:DUF998 domain-containing protein [Scytonematopsis contorta HA4267-MV1]
MNGRPLGQSPDDADNESAQSSNWYMLPGNDENDEEILGDLQELQNKGEAKNPIQSAEWKVANKLTKVKTTHLKIMGATPSDESKGENTKAYEKNLLTRLKVSFYGVFGVGAVGIAVFCTGVGYTIAGNPTVGGGLMAGASGLGFVATLCNDAYKRTSDSADKHFGGNTDSKDGKDKGAGTNE